MQGGTSLSRADRTTPQSPQTARINSASPPERRCDRRTGSNPPPQPRSPQGEAREAAAEKQESSGAGDGWRQRSREARLLNHTRSAMDVPYAGTATADGGKPPEARRKQRCPQRISGRRRTRRQVAGSGDTWRRTRTAKTVDGGRAEEAWQRRRVARSWRTDGGGEGGGGREVATQKRGAADLAFNGGIGGGPADVEQR